MSHEMTTEDLKSLLRAADLKLRPAHDWARQFNWWLHKKSGAKVNVMRAEVKEDDLSLVVSYSHDGIPFVRPLVEFLEKFERES